MLVSGSGWWKRENVNLLKHVINEFAENASITYAGTIVRPHIYAMRTNDRISPEGEKVLSAIRQAAGELIETGEFSQDILDAISRPLVSREVYEELLG